MQKQTTSQAIYKFLKANKLSTAQQVATALNLNVNTVSKLLWQLAKRNAVQQVKVDGMRCMYVAQRNAKFNAPKAQPRKTSTKQTKQVLELKQAIVLMQKLLQKMEA
jgi:DNA-binding transcriptional regulator YhcF (GntR family)